MDEFKLIVASNLIKLRTSAGLTQAELGDKISYSDKTVSKWERAESIPDTYALKQIADIYGVSVDFILTSHDEWKSESANKMSNSKGLAVENIIIMITLASEFMAAFLVFTIFWILKLSFMWKTFVYALPIILLTWLILNSVWHKGKHNFIIVSLFVISLLMTVYISLLSVNANPWQLFVLAIPAEIIVILSFLAVHFKKKN